LICGLKTDGGRYSHPGTVNSVSSGLMHGRFQVATNIFAMRQFYAAKDDFRLKERKLLCPFCGIRFLDKEAREVIDSE
jgi:hypothetical protein